MVTAIRTRPVRRNFSRRGGSTPRPPRTAFVLSGGASFGALQVGMLQALYERGIAPDFLVATSVGALNAAFVASRSQTPAASIPGIFPPVEIGHQRLVDGGVVNNTPISHAVELGAERVYVLPTQEPGRFPRRAPQSALDTAMYGLGLPIEARVGADIARYSQEVELVVLPAPNTAGVQPTSFDHSGHLIGEALTAARARLAEQNAGRHLRLVATEVR